MAISSGKVTDLPMFFCQPGHHKIFCRVSEFLLSVHQPTVSHFRSGESALHLAESAARSVTSLVDGFNMFVAIPHIL